MTITSTRTLPPPSPTIAPPNPGAEPAEGRRIIVRPWIDPIVERRGFDARHTYVETYWLGVIGPTAMWIMRRFAQEFDHSPDGFSVGVDALARGIGVSAAKGPASPFDRALDRCVRFGLARVDQSRHTGTSAGRDHHLALEVRRRLPQIPARSLRRLPDDLADTHQDWVREHQRRQIEPDGLSADTR